MRPGCCRPAPQRDPRADAGTGGLRPKSDAGWRVIPMAPWIHDASLARRDGAPENQWGLVWPTSKGRPTSQASDTQEWRALQGTVSVVEGEDGHLVDLADIVVAIRRDATTSRTRHDTPRRRCCSRLVSTSRSSSRSSVTPRRRPPAATSTPGSSRQPPHSSRSPAGCSWCAQPHTFRPPRTACECPEC